MTTPNEVAEFLQGAGAGQAAIDQAVAHFLALPPAREARANAIAVKDVLPAYRRRLRKLPADVVGLAEVVSRLERCDRQFVLVDVRAQEGRVTSILRSLDGSLVGCVVGPDRRSGPALQADD